MLMLLTVLMGFAAVYVVDKPNRRALAEYEAKWEQGCHAAGGKIQ